MQSLLRYDTRRPRIQRKKWTEFHQHFLETFVNTIGKVKRQPAEWEKILNHRTDRILVFRTHKKLL